jgi:hypothetical protein
MHRRVSLLAGVLLLLMAPEAGATCGIPPPDALVVVVGGLGSQSDYDPGILDTANWLSEHPLWFPLPNLPFPSLYLSIESEIEADVRSAVNANRAVILVGYSHGAALLLRVVSQLANEGVDLHRVFLATVDPVTDGYPLPKYERVPHGIGAALNVYQTLPTAILQGESVVGAYETEVGALLLVERDLLRDISLDWEERTALEPHRFIQHSLIVRRAILTWLNVCYLPGVWQVDVSGTLLGFFGKSRPFSYSQPMLLDVSRPWDGPPWFFHLKRGPDFFSGKYSWGGPSTTANEVGFNVSTDDCDTINGGSGHTEGLFVPDFTAFTLQADGLARCVGESWEFDGGVVTGALLLPPILPLTGVPPTPTGVTATVSGTNVAVLWSASARATGYRVAATGPGIQVNLPVGNVTRVDGGNLPPGFYDVSIFAQGPSGDNPVPAIISFTIGNTPPETLPPTPTGISNTVAGRNVTIIWIASPGATSYHVTALLNGIVVFNQDVGNTTRVDGPDVPPGNYTVNVFSANAAGRNAAPATTSFTIDGAPPGNPPPAPTGIANAIAGRDVTITWIAAPGATSYYVAALLNGAVVFSQNVGNISRVDGPNVPPGNYTVQVFSVNPAGRSPTAAITTFSVQ